MPKICPRYKKCPKEFSARCGCGKVHIWECTLDECEHYTKAKIICREATPEEVLLANGSFKEFILPEYSIGE